MNAEKSNPIICVVTVDISADRSADIEIHLHDDCRALAKSFAAQHGQNAVVIDALASHLFENHCRAKDRLDVILRRKQIKLEYPGQCIDNSVRSRQGSEVGSIEPEVTAVPPAAEREMVPSHQDPSAAPSTGRPRSSTAGSTAESRRSSAGSMCGDAPTAPSLLPRPSSAAQCKLPRVASLASIKSRQSEGEGQCMAKPEGVAKPETFNRLHRDAEGRTARARALADRLAQTEAEAVEAGRRRMSGADLPGASRSRSNSGAGEIDPIAASKRLYEGAALAAQKRASQALSAREEAEGGRAWVCATCGAENGGKEMACVNPYKGGKAKSGVDGCSTVCGAHRPAEGKPAISAFAKGLVRGLSAADEEYINWQVAQHREGKAAREEEAKKAQEEAFARNAPFKPKLNEHSLALAEAARARAKTQHAAAAVHDVLYVEGMQHKRDVVLGTYQEAVLAGCTFQPGTRPGPVPAALPVSRLALFQRLHAEGAAAAERADAVRKLADARAKAGIVGNRVQGITPLEAARLYDESKQRASAKAAALAQAVDGAKEAAQVRHTTAKSEHLLQCMRQRALVGLFRALIATQVLTPDQRDVATGQDLEETESVHPDGLNGDTWHHNVGPASLQELQGRNRVQRLSASDTARLVASLDTFPEEVSVEGSLDLLDLHSCWTGGLDSVLGKLVNMALKQLAMCNSNVSHQDGAGPFASHSNCVDLPSFTAVLGRLIEEAAGGPHVYVQARKARKAAAVEARAASAAAAEAEHMTFAPALDKRSLHMAEEVRSRTRLGEGGRRGMQDKRRALELDGLRGHLALQPSHALADPAVRARLAAREEHSDLAARARAVLKRQNSKVEASLLAVAGECVENGPSPGHSEQDGLDRRGGPYEAQHGDENAVPVQGEGPTDGVQGKGECRGPVAPALLFSPSRFVPVSVEEYGYGEGQEEDAEVDSIPVAPSDHPQACTDLDTAGLSSAMASLGMDALEARIARLMQITTAVAGVQ